VCRGSLQLSFFDANLLLNDQPKVALLRINETFYNILYSVRGIVVANCFCSASAALLATNCIGSGIEIDEAAGIF
jgi:hypothetical protein